jgi:thioredoxin-like negative regulator of GroEL
MTMRVSVDHSAHCGEPDQPRIRIETLDDYESATRRIAALDASSRGETEERERAALVEAIAAWDRRHDDVSDWREPS